MKTLARLGSWMVIAACSVGCLAEVEDPEQYDEADPQVEPGVAEEVAADQASLADGAERAAWPDSVSDANCASDAECALDEAAPMTVAGAVGEDLDTSDHEGAFEGGGSPADGDSAFSAMGLPDGDTNPDPTPWENTWKHNPDPTPWRHPWSP